MASNEQLLLKTAKHDQKAFKQLYDATSGQLYHLISRYIFNEHIAQEVLQDTYLKIWQKSSQYNESKGKASTWINRIAINTAFDKLRSQSIRPQAHCSEIDINDVSRAQDETADSLAIHTALDQLKKDLERLPLKQRDCLLLSSCYGYTHQELAHKLRLPLGTIKSLIRRGKAELQQQLTLLHG